MIDFTKLVDFIKGNLKKLNWDKAIFKIEFGIGNSRGGKLRYYYQAQEFKKVLSVIKYGPILGDIFYDFDKGIKKRDFNKVIITITKEDYSVEYEMDEEKIIEERQSSALLFSNYLYESMRTQIFEHEQANNLLIPIYDEDGEFLEYEDTWDRGVFTFIVDSKAEEIKYTIELFKNGIKRLVPIELTKDYKESILYHHKLTHNELKKYWQPWNKIILTAPGDFIPLGKEQEYIEYSQINYSEGV
ncbi:hypothetical protein MK851_06410 [Tenacibaculum sp. 1B UA]|uniref:hypothetical protein n=1 Tax=Tenacibaculum sp. 1B UA TaxID=2922252 RepID=UPI002A241BD2|nr:hypothetical protein [Tenacibaculum sp. 1B UA]MDX8553260.1 hypothetical protein [Tenacibaculum sp. 1B UA]